MRGGCGSGRGRSLLDRLWFFNRLNCNASRNVASFFFSYRDWNPSHTLKCNNHCPEIRLISLKQETLLFPIFVCVVDSDKVQLSLMQSKKGRDKLTDPVDYLNAHFTGRPIFRYIQTHPDMDHMAGLFKLCYEARIPIVNFWDTSHSVEKEDFAKRTGAVAHDIRDWQTYQVLRKGQDPRVLRLSNGAQNDFYRQDGIHIWAPFDHRHEKDVDADPNELSYMLCISVGKCNILLGGDATVETWQALYKANHGTLPKIHVLKASHHGRKSGYDRDSVKAMDPDYTILSVGELKAKDDASASYERYSNVGCYSTVDHGNIVARCYENGVVYLYDQDNKLIA